MSILPVGERAQSSNLLQVSTKYYFWEIEKATHNFDEQFVIGRGGHSKVYKGTITVGENDDQLQDVAIKRLESSSEEAVKEFAAELDVLSKVKHPHLVPLIGYCNDGTEMIIVTEYMRKGTLASRLHKPHKHPPLTCVTRLKILLGAARGLNHLHTGTRIDHGVIHRDFKSLNIVLDDIFEAKICDFGLSKTGEPNLTSENLRGTPGYEDPDYRVTGVPTQKSDVYAFGVVMLEMLCAKKAAYRGDAGGQVYLTKWAQECIKNRMLDQIVDCDLLKGAGPISKECLNEFAQLAVLCLHKKPYKRPTMADVVAGLQSILALQEKANKHAIKCMKEHINGSKVSSLLKSIKWGKKSEPVIEGTRSLELHLYTVGVENRILHRYDLETISVSTQNFSEANKISQDEFGTMYKGRLQSGQDIAIYGTSSDIQHEFYKHESSILVNVDHENLIQLLGYCIEGTSVHLVYGFAPFATLDRLIFDHSHAPLDWDQRHKIILGIARVLLYLHKHAPVRIIHGDIKTGRVMLDNDLDPKLFGFCFARSGARNEADCIKMNMPSSTMGYSVPEFRSADTELSTKCDVYSFGALLLETITGRERMEPFRESTKSLVYDARINWEAKTCKKLIDPRIEVDSSLMETSVLIGLLCTQEDPSNRPGMDKVVEWLLFSDVPESNSEVRAMKQGEWQRKVGTIKSNRVRSAKASTSA